jgi:hypothetical protein
MLIPGALILTNISLVPGDDRGVAEKMRARMKKRKKKKKKKKPRKKQKGGQNGERAREPLKTRGVLFRHASGNLFVHTGSTLFPGLRFTNSKPRR